LLGYCDRVAFGRLRGFEHFALARLQLCRLLGLRACKLIRRCDCVALGRLHSVEHFALARLQFCRLLGLRACELFGCCDCIALGQQRGFERFALARLRLRAQARGPARQLIRGQAFARALLKFKFRRGARFCFATRLRFGGKPFFSTLSGFGFCCDACRHDLHSQRIELRARLRQRRRFAFRRRQRLGRLAAARFREFSRLHLD
jgi:hypothetical protein